MTIPIEIVSAAIAAFLSVLGFGFMVIWQNTKAINAINITLSEINTKEKASVDKHNVIDTRLNEHSAKIQAHGLILTEHDVKIKELMK